MAAPASGGSDAPRYHQLALTLAARIGAGAYAVGDLLPGEEHLCREFGLSRHTVRSALRQLQDAGLVHKSNGIGTRVIAATPPRRFAHTIASVEDLLQYAIDTRLANHRTRRVQADARLAEAFACPRGTGLLRIDALRIAARQHNDAVIAWSRIHVLDTYADIVADLPTLTHAIGTHIEMRFGERITAIEQSVSALALDATQARRFNLPEHSPALRVDRRYLGRNGKPFEIVTSIHPAQSFTLTMRLDRSQGA